MASRTILRMLKFRTRFQGQTVSHMPHWIAVLEGVSAARFDDVDDLFVGGYDFHGFLALFRPWR